MRHQKAFRKLGRNPSHRRALFRNLATSLIIHNRIETTLPKAKELKRIADKLVTLGKKDTLHARRQALAYLFAQNRTKNNCKTKDVAVHKLFTELAPQFAERQGGYTRVLRTRVRDGDKAQMAIIEFVQGAVEAKETGRKKRRVKRVKKDSESAEAKKADTKKAAPKKQESDDSSASKKETGKKESSKKATSKEDSAE